MKKIDPIKAVLILKPYLLLILFLVGCSKNTTQTEDNGIIPDEAVPDENSSENERDETFVYTSSATYNLNIVYFVPKGSKQRNDSHRRLSEILLRGQEFYRQEMIRNGFGDKTFNLFVDSNKNKVKIDYVEGKLSASNYPYEGGGNKMIEEIEAYYDDNPGTKASDHVLVISPVNDPQNNDAPYYGLGKWCFATDYDDMDVKYLDGNSRLSILATTYIGGLLHELGHGLNLPHNKEKVSQGNNMAFGTALMGAGNYTYGSAPTFLTASSCAILNNNQVFSESSEVFYSGAVANIEGLQASYENNGINISGSISTDIPVESIGIYNDPADDNADYDAVTWMVLVENNAFDVVMPLNEFYKKGDTEYVLRFLLNHTNGDITRLSYSYTFKNGIPMVTFGEQDYLDRTSWSITSFSSQENAGGEGATGRAVDILDGDMKTYWHSCWSTDCSNNEYPHSIVIDMGGDTMVRGFSFLQRNTLSRAIRSVEIRISEDGTKWQSLGSYGLKQVNTVQNIQLENSETFRYFELIPESSHDSSQFAALAEVYCY